MEQPRIIPVPADGAEDVWTGTEDGSIYRIRPDGGLIERVANTGGRPLGLELHDGLILIADAHLGLITLDPETGLPVDVVADQLRDAIESGVCLTEPASAVAMSVQP